MIEAKPERSTGFYLKRALGYEAYKTAVEKMGTPVLSGTPLEFKIPTLVRRLAGGVCGGFAFLAPGLSDFHLNESNKLSWKQHLAHLIKGGSDGINLGGSLFGTVGIALAADQLGLKLEANPDGYAFLTASWGFTKVGANISSYAFFDFVDRRLGINQNPH